MSDELPKGYALAVAKWVRENENSDIHEVLEVRTTAFSPTSDNFNNGIYPEFSVEIIFNTETYDDRLSYFVTEVDQIESLWHAIMHGYSERETT